jgi:hypothetical protein
MCQSLNIGCGSEGENAQMYTSGSAPPTEKVPSLSVVPQWWPVLLKMSLCKSS